MLMVPISWGDFVDKLTILEIKVTKASSERSLGNVKREYQGLFDVAGSEFEVNKALSQLRDELKAVNQRLWEIEDNIRFKEKTQSFDEDFIALARSVYINNDNRALIKRNINLLMKSDLVEEKFYADYGFEKRNRY